MLSLFSSTARLPAMFGSFLSKMEPVPLPQVACVIPGFRTLAAAEIGLTFPFLTICWDIPFPPPLHCFSREPLRERAGRSIIPPSGSLAISVNLAGPCCTWPLRPIPSLISYAPHGGMLAMLKMPSGRAPVFITFAPSSAQLRPQQSTLGASTGDHLPETSHFWLHVWELI